MVALPFDPALQFVLVLIALVSGVGITTIGPGGIFVTIALYSLTPISSGKVAGTAHVTFIATGLLASAMFAYSGEMNLSGSRVMAVILSITSVVGAFLGAYLNSFVSRDLFGLLLGVLAMGTGVVLAYREQRDLRPVYDLDVATGAGRLALGVLGLGLGIASGLLGVGGPVIAVPALVLVGVPMLSALAVAQIQSIFIATFAAWGYFVQGNVVLSLALLVGTPLLVGVAVGWRIAYAVDPARLKVALGVVLFAVGLYLTL